MESYAAGEATKKSTSNYFEVDFVFSLEDAVICILVLFIVRATSMYSGYSIVIL